MRCKECGHELREGARFCPECGNEVTLQKEQKNMTGLIIAGVAVLVVVLGFILISKMGLFSGRGNNDQQNSVSGQMANQGQVNPEDLVGNGAIQDDVSYEEEDEQEVYDSTEGGIHQYKFFVDDCTWSEALTKAVQSGGYLVRINSAEEYSHILTQIKREGYDNIMFRIGGRRDENNNYYWVDENNNFYGDIINSNSYWASGEWMQGEPSFVDGEIQEDCLDIYYFSREGRWVWNDVPNDIIEIVPTYSGKVGYIVEYEQ